MTSSVVTEAFHVVNGMKDSCSGESSRPSSSKEAADNSVFTINVEFCGGLEQLTENKAKELQLRFVRRKNGSEQTRPFSCSSSGAERSQVNAESVNSGIVGSPHVCCGGDNAAAGATAEEASTSHTEVDVPGADASGRRDKEEEAEESVPLYQVIGFLSSFVLSERPDMFADPYEGAPVDATATGAQRQHEDGEDGEITYPIDYLLPGGFSPPMQLRPGVLALINDVDTEVLGGMEAPVYSSDCVTFISTLHGG